MGVSGKHIGGGKSLQNNDYLLSNICLLAWFNSQPSEEPNAFLATHLRLPPPPPPPPPVDSRSASKNSCCLFSTITGRSTVEMADEADLDVVGVLLAPAEPPMVANCCSFLNQLVSISGATE